MQKFCILFCNNCVLTLKEWLLRFRNVYNKFKSNRSYYISIIYSRPTILYNILYRVKDLEKTDDAYTEILTNFFLEFFDLQYFYLVLASISCFINLV